MMMIGILDETGLHAHMGLSAGAFAMSWNLFSITQKVLQFVDLVEVASHIEISDLGSPSESFI